MIAALRWSPPTLLRAVPASQAFLSAFLALAAMAMGQRPVALAFAISALAFLLAFARVRPRSSILLGAVLTVGGLAWVTATQAPALSLMAVMGIPPLALAAMALLDPAGR